MSIKKSKIYCTNSDRTIKCKKYGFKTFTISFSISRSLQLSTLI